MKVISHVRKGNTTKALLTDDLGDLVRLDVGTDRNGEPLGLLFFGEINRDPEGRANFKYVITIRDGVLGPEMRRVISLIATRSGKFRYGDLPQGERQLSETIYDLVVQHQQEGEDNDA